MSYRSDIIDVLIEEKHLELSEKDHAFDVLNQTSTSNSPWYIQLLIGGGAWLASLLFMIFIGFTGVFNDQVSYIILGAVIVVITLALSMLTHRSSSLFLEQVLLAASLTGHGSLILGLAGQYTEQTIIIATAVIFLSTINILLYKSLFHKLLATWGFLLGSAIFMYELGFAQLPLMVFFLLIPSALMAWMWMNESRFVVGKWAEIGKPILYALTLYVLYGARISEQLSWIVHDFLNRDGDAIVNAALYIKALGVGYFIILAYVISAILKRLKVSLISFLGVGLILVSAFLSAAFYQSSSILVALILLLIGIERGNKILVPLAVISLVAFYSEYYYNLDLTLMKKSIVLASSGLVLLLAGWLTNRLGERT